MGVFPANKPSKGLRSKKVFTSPPLLMILLVALNWGVRAARSQLPPIFQGPPGFHESCRSSLTPSTTFSNLLASDFDSLLERKQGKSRNPITHPAFTLLSSESVDDHAMNAAVYVHRTGLRVYSLSSPASDGEMSLSICFRTPSKEMYGTSHVLAEAVLQGSVRYPVSSLISKISKKSLGSYFYDHVWPERTCFDMASTNKKDFYNLLGVYLDSVFQPLAVRDPLILAQAGWRYELVPKGRGEDTEEETEKETAVDCVASPHLCELRFAGRQYEDAKSKLKMVEYILFQSEVQGLFPDVEPYAKFTAGELKEMSNLTFSHLKRYHEAHYTPQNGWIVIHGPDDVKDRLDFIDDYLRSINAKDAMPRDTQIQAQPAFKAPRYSERSYATDSEHLEDFVVLEWVLNPGPSDEYSNEENEIAFRVLSYLLVDGERAPLAKALKASGLGKVYHMCLPFLFKHRTFSVGLRGVEQREGAAAEIEVLIMKTLKELPPFTAAAIEEAIDGAELKYASLFRALEQPDGITVARLMNVAITHNRDPLLPLRYSEGLKALKRRLADGEKVFETIIHKYLVSNPHRLTLRLKASDTMQGDLEEAEERLLESVKSQMTQQQLKAIVDQQEKIRERFDTPDTPEALSTLPVLKREDISQKTQEMPFTQTAISGSPLLLFPVPRPNLVYFDVVFSLSSLSLSDLQLLPLLGLMLEEAGTQELLPEHFEYLINKNAWLSSGYQFVPNPAIPFSVPNPRDALGYFFIKGEALNRKLGSLLCLLHLMLLSPAFGNGKIGINLIKRLINNRGKRFFSDRVQLAAFHSVGKFGAGLLGFEGTKGISSLSFYKKLLKQAMVDWAPIACRLNSLWNRLVSRSNILFSITGDAAALSSVTTGPFSGPLKALVEALPERRNSNNVILDKEREVLRGTKKATKEDERGHPPKAFTELPQWAVEAEEKGLLVPSTKKAYVVPAVVSDLSMSLPFLSPGSLISAAATAAAIALKEFYLDGLTKKEMGGKEVLGLLNNEGVYTFASKNDHNVLDTIMYFLGAAEWLKRWASSASDQDVFEVLLSYIKKIEKPIRDEEKAHEGLLRWVKGLTEADRVKNKMRILETTKEDILVVAGNFGNQLKEESPAVTVIGSLRDVHTLQNEGLDLEIIDVEKMNS